MMADRLKKLASKAAAAAVNISRPNYFEPQRRDTKGELQELRSDLANDLGVLKKEALKRIIAFMTVGRDVSPLFADVIKCMQTGDIEQKKLVYLYLINYAKSQPDLVILAINTLCKDTEDKNPLIKALALRTMGCIRVMRLLDYINEPLQRCARDRDAYVRKAVALCIAKVHDLSPEYVDECGLLDLLVELAEDRNPSVVAAAVAAMADISHELLGQVLSVQKLLSALADCNEWGQVAILDALCDMPASSEHGRAVLESCLPRMQHANPAVVMSAARLCLRAGASASELRRIGASVVALLGTCPEELQYALLRNLRVIQAAHPGVFPADSAKHFFCHFDEPLCVKLEKVALLQALHAQDEKAIVDELMDYAKDVNARFSRAAIDALAKIAPGRVLGLFQAGIQPEHCILCMATVDGAALAKQVSECLVFSTRGKTAQLRLVGRRHPELLLALFARYRDTFGMEPPAVQSALLDAAFVGAARNSKEAFGDCLEAFLHEAARGPLLVREKGALYATLRTHPTLLAKLVDAVEASPEIVVETTGHPDLFLPNLNTVAAILHRHIEGAKPVFIAPGPQSGGSDDGKGIHPQPSISLLDMADWDDAQLNPAAKCEDLLSASSESFKSARSTTERASPSNDDLIDIFESE